MGDCVEIVELNCDVGSVTYEDAGVEEEASEKHHGIAVTRWFSTIVQGNVFLIREATLDISIVETEEEIVVALESVIVGETSLDNIIAKRDMEYGANYSDVKNEMLFAGECFPGLRPKLNNISSLSRGVAESLTLFRLYAGKQPGGGGPWNLTSPRTNENPGMGRVVTN